MTPTQFILEAARKTPRVFLPMDKEINYTFESYPEARDDYCWLCGGETGGIGTLRKKTIKDSFTDIQSARYLTSESICPGCSFCLSHMSLRNYSIFATPLGLFHPTRPEMKEIILNIPITPFLFCIAESGQRWLHYRSKINFSEKDFYVRLEDIEIRVIPEKFREIIDIVENLYEVFSKEEIRSGRFSQERIRKFGIERFSEVEERLNVLKRQEWKMAQLAIFLSQKKEVTASVV